MSRLMFDALGRKARLGIAALVLVAASTVAAQAAKIERVVSPGGIEAWLIEDHTNPIVAVQFALKAGAAYDPKGKEGLAEMTSALLDEGAGDLDSQAFQGKLQDSSISLGFDAAMDRFSGGLKTLTRNRAEAFDLLRLALTAPRFDADGRGAHPRRDPGHPVARGRESRSASPARSGGAKLPRASLWPAVPGHGRDRSRRSAAPTSSTSSSSAWRATP